MSNSTVIEHKPKRFLSLKWKALYLTSILFLVLTLVYLLSGKAYIDRQFKLKREDANQQYRNELRVLVEQSAHKLHQMAGTVVLLQGMSEALSDRNASSLGDVFENHWWKFEIDSAIDSAAFYSTQGELLHRWGLNVKDHALAKKTIRSERPEWQVSCEDSCQILAAAPLLVDGVFNSVIVFSTSFTDAILNFHAITGMDIGVLVDSEDKSASPGAAQFWQRKLIALTDAKNNMPLLNDFEQYSPRLMPVNARAMFSRAGAAFEIAMLPINRVEQDNDSRIIVISNVTPDVESARKIFRNTLLGSLLGLILSELILLAILWKPTTQLQRVVDALPLLAENNFEEARAGFRSVQGRTLITDESDILKAASLNLSYQLETLHSLLNNRALQLENRGIELETERNFVLGLLNTAHALILTQDSKGDIVMINHHGEKLLGLKTEAIIGSKFAGILNDKNEAEQISRQLAALLSGDVEELHHETAAVNHAGEPRYISWFHSRLPDRSDGKHHLLTVGIDISERRTAEENLGWLASHDPLTGLLNRRRFEDELEHVMATCHRYGHSGALLFFDLDQFKDVNDSSGHQVGDELLKRVAEALLESARESDVVARLGGDEFAILLQEADQISAGETAERFCRALMKIAVPGSRRIHRISGSIGIALFPEHGKEASMVLANADIAMYQAKAAGRNTWSIFNENQHGKERIHERVYWNETVRQIYHEETFDLYFQPIVNVKTGNVIHYEALLRVPGEDGKMGSSFKFISAAERAGLMPGMDEKIIDKAMLYLRQLQQCGQSTRFAVNLSGLSFRNENLVVHIRDCLARYDINPHNVMFEITETAAVADTEIANKVIDEIRAIGCQFALDDFGTGFSSLHYLKQMPVDYLKIDGSFISNLHQDKGDRVVVQALVNIAREYGHKTIAEFVESREIMTVLEELGVDYAQGYYIGKPLPFNEVWKLS